MSRICDTCGPKHGTPKYSQKRKVARCAWCKQVMPTAEAAVYGLEAPVEHVLKAGDVVLSPHPR